MNANETKIDLAYKEYVRLIEKSDAYIQRSFGDFKNLAALGAIVVSLPAIAEVLDSNTIFIYVPFGVLALVAILGLRDLVVCSVSKYYMSRAVPFENMIRQELRIEDTEIFSSASASREWIARRHRRVSAYFYGYFSFVLVAFPLSALLVGKMVKLSIIYVLCSAVTFFIFFLAQKTLFDDRPGTEMSNKLKQG